MSDQTLDPEEQARRKSAHAVIRRHWFNAARNTVLKREALLAFEEVKARLEEASVVVGAFPVKVTIVDDHSGVGMGINCQNSSVVRLDYRSASLVLDSTAVVATWEPHAAKFVPAIGDSVTDHILDVMLAEVFAR